MEQESRREREKMTETTQERVKNARKRLDIAEKWELPTMDPNFFAIVELADEVKKLSDMNASLGTMINDKVAEIDKLETKLAELKEKMRWRKQSEEPAPKGKDIEAYSPIRKYVFYRAPSDSLLSHWYWRPLDLPEEGAE